jgi:hypothetical protein
VPAAKPLSSKRQGERDEGANWNCRRRSRAHRMSFQDWRGAHPLMAAGQSSFDLGERSTGCLRLEREHRNRGWGTGDATM